MINIKHPTEMNTQLEPLRHIQTSLKTDKARGNCLQTCLACLMRIDISDVIPIHEHFTEDWATMLIVWLLDRNYELESINMHLFDDSYYLVSGETERGTLHVVIYQNGKLFHDPHPSNSGLSKEIHYQKLSKICS